MISGITLSALVAAAAFVFSVWKQRDDRKSSREAEAKKIWRDYLQLAFEHPDLTEKTWSELTSEAKGRKPNEEYFAIEKFEWFVSVMFFSAEEILETSQHVEWKKVIKNQIGYFSDYIYGFGSQYNPTYSKAVRRLIEEVEGEIKAAEKDNQPNPYKGLSWRLSHA